MYCMEKIYFIQFNFHEGIIGKMAYLVRCKCVSRFLDGHVLLFALCGRNHSFGGKKAPSYVIVLIFQYLLVKKLNAARSVHF